jgi:D-glycero-D-manno-heptose 1,7-bisphosphate phosphatase
VIVVTNQTIVGKGLITADGLDEIHARMCRAVQSAGGSILDVLYCPHLAAENCACRKPKPGLLHVAAQRHGIDLGASFYVGDALSDVQAGQAAGCRCVLVETGRGRSQVLREEARFFRDYHVAGDLLGAVKWILAQQAVMRRTRR